MEKIDGILVDDLHLQYFKYCNQLQTLDVKSQKRQDLEDFLTCNVKSNSGLFCASMAKFFKRNKFQEQLFRDFLKSCTIEKIENMMEYVIEMEEGAQILLINACKRRNLTHIKELNFNLPKCLYFFK